MHRDVSAAEARARAVELLDLVDMPDPTKRVDYYPTSSPAVSASAR